MKKLSVIAILIFSFSLSVFAQLNLPRESQRQSVSQTIGDTTVTIVYHRPNVKAREVWGNLVPYDEVWRTGANENTTFETTNDLKINGKILPKGKYGLHTIPTKGEWTIILTRLITSGKFQIRCETRRSARYRQTDKCGFSGNDVARF